MRRKQDQEGIKKKQIQKQQIIEYSHDTEIMILIPYIKMMPMSMQSKFALALKQVTDKQFISEPTKQIIDKILATCSSNVVDVNKNWHLLQLFCRFLKLNKLRQSFLNLSKKSSSKQKSQQNNISKETNNFAFVPFQPNIQKQTVKFQPIQHIINPNYENIIKLYKTFTDVHINMEYKIKELNENYTFFSQPRFSCKLQQMRDFQSAFGEKGNILMMSFEGSKIIGKRGFAFSNNNTIYWWEKNYKDIRDLIPQTSEDKQKDQKEKGKRDQVKNQQIQKLKFHQNFKLTFKMVSHHGKITSLSLSDDQYFLISSGTDKLIKLWCLRQKCLLAEFRGHTKTIWSVSFSKSGYFFLSGSADKTIKLWSTDDSIAQRVFVGHSEDVTKVDFMKNPDLIASASEDKTVRIWNTFNTQCINILTFDNAIINFKSSISGRYFAVCDSSGKLSLYDLLKGEIMSSFKVPQKEHSETGKIKYLRIHDMCFSMDQKQFTCVSSKYIVIYSVEKISERESKNIFIESGRENNERTVATKQVINTGRDSNLVYCDYHDKGVLLVATTLTKKY